MKRNHALFYIIKMIMIFVLFDLLKNDIYFAGLNRLPDFAIFIIATLFLILIASGRALLFKKAGFKPIQAFIPFYSTYKYYEIFWKGKYGLIEMVLTNAFYMLLPRDQRLLNAGAIGYICLTIYVLKFMLLIVAQLKLSKSFNKSLFYTFGLVFMEAIFVLIIGLSKSEYLGPTLIEYNNEALDLNPVKITGQYKNNKEYMISLYRWRSILALLACVVTLIMAVIALSENIIYDARIDRVGYSFKYFTVITNVMIALAASCIIPYAIDGIRKKRFSYPKWVALIHYSGTICTTITMIFAVLFISRFDRYLAFGGYNLIYHVICPIAILISFMLVESGHEFGIHESIFCLLPFTLYAIIYSIQVLMIGEENGGWADLYKFITLTPVSFSLPAMFMMAIVVSAGIAKIYNYLSRYRKNRMHDRWPKDASEVEVKIEVYGLGRYMGMHEDVNNASLPMDILLDMASYYNLNQNDLIRAYTKGMIDGNAEKVNRDKYRYNDLSAYIGTPYYLSSIYKQKQHNKTTQ